MVFGLIIIVLIIVVVAIIVSRKSLEPGSQPAPVRSYSAPPNIPAEGESEYKNCPLCGEEIKSVAVKCKHCNSFLAAKGGVTRAGGMDDGTLGLVSLISGIVGFFIGILLVHLGVLLGLAAVVCGVLGFGKGQKYSLPGIVIGIVAILFSLIYSNLIMRSF